MTVKRHAMKAVLAGGVVTLLLFLGIGLALAHPNGTSTTIGFSDNPATDGDIVTITATVTYTGDATAVGGHAFFPLAGDPVAGDDVKIQRLELAGVPVECGTALASFEPFADGVTDGSGVFITPFDTTGFGGSTICFRAHHTPSGGAHGNGNSFSPQVDLVINLLPACTPGVNVGATLASGDGAPAPGDSGPWSFQISVENCTGSTLTGVKVQGGSNGWAPVPTPYVDNISVSAGAFAVRTNNKNQVITWTVTIADGATETIDVTVDGTVPAGAVCDSVRFLSGPWSAVYNLPADDPDIGPIKSSYTGRVSLTVTCP
jgi:hypothetical protein